MDIFLHIFCHSGALKTTDNFVTELLVYVRLGDELICIFLFT